MARDPAEFDVVVVGGGPAGEHAAARSSKAGLRTVLVEAELVGGECSYWACMPSKTLLRPGQVLASARRTPGAGEATTGALDTRSALARRNWMSAYWDDTGQQRWLDRNGIALVRGRGRLAGERTVEVEGAGARLTARRAVILATGSRPVLPPIDGLGDIRTWDSRAATSAREAPDRLAVLGGGVVGVEMAQAWRRLGATEVTVLEAGDRLLANEEPFAGEAVGKALAAEGVAVRTSAKVVSVARAGVAVRATLDDGESLLADELLVATGRRPSTADLGLDSVGLEPGRAVQVDDTMRAEGVDGRWLYAIGDANGRALLTHIGKYQARIAVDSILGLPVRALADTSAVPRVVFTDPQVAAVGLTEGQARGRGITVRTSRADLESVAAAPILGEGVTGTSQLVVDAERDVLAGATFVGPDVGELLHSATVAVVGEVTMSRLRHAVAAFPTMSELWLSLVEAYDPARDDS